MKTLIELRPVRVSLRKLRGLERTHDLYLKMRKENEEFYRQNVELASHQAVEVKIDEFS